MSGPVFVEVLGRHREVTQRVALDRLPATVGRGYDNQVILDDPHVAPQHLRIERSSSDEIFLTDLGSKNGLFIQRPNRRVGQTVVGPETLVRIGHTLLRVRASDYQVPAETEDRSSRRWQRALAPTLLVAAAASWPEVEESLTAYREREPWEMSWPIMSLIVLAAWVVPWSVLTRVNTGRACAGRHLVIAARALLVWLAAGAAGGYISYALSSSLPGQLASAAVLLWCVKALHDHLRLVSRREPAALAALAAVVVALAAGLAWLANRNREESVNDVAYLRDLKAPIFRLAAPTSSERLFERAARLRVKVDALRDEKAARDDRRRGARENSAAR